MDRRRDARLRVLQAAADREPTGVIERWGIDETAAWVDLLQLGHVTAASDEHGDDRLEITVSGRAYLAQLRTSTNGNGA